MKSKLELLKRFGKIADSLKDKNIPDSYWKKEEEILEKIIEGNKKRYQSIQMSRDKYHQQYI